MWMRMRTRIFEKCGLSADADADADIRYITDMVNVQISKRSFSVLNLLNVAVGVRTLHFNRAT